jgi:hypothetical protein
MSEDSLLERVTTAAAKAALPRIGASRMVSVGKKTPIYES